MSVLQLLGYRGFKSETEIKQIVFAELGKNNSSIGTNIAQKMTADLKFSGSMTSLKKTANFDDIRALKFFQTSRQQTWIVSIYNDIYCLLDDIQIDIDSGKELLKWKMPSNKLNLVINDSVKNPKYGLIDFNENHKGWYYSKSILRDKNQAEYAINNLVFNSGFNAQYIYARFANEPITIEFKENSTSYSKYGKYISGFLWFPSPEHSHNFYGEVKINSFQKYEHQLLKLGLSLTGAAKALYKIDDATEKKLKEEEGFFCSDIENIMYLVPISMKNI